MIFTYPYPVIITCKLRIFQASGPERGPAAQRRVDFEVQAGTDPGQADAWRKLCKLDHESMQIPHLHRLNKCIKLIHALLGNHGRKRVFTPGVSEFPSFQSILPSTNPWDVLMLGFRACFRPSFGIRPQKNTYQFGWYA